MDSSTISITGPLAPHLSGLWNFLLARSYSPLSAKNLCRLLAHLSRWLKRERLPLQSLKPEDIESFLTHRRRCGYVHFLTHRALSPILEYLTQVGAVKIIRKRNRNKLTFIEKLLQNYSRYLTHERCLGEESRTFYLKVAKDFLSKQGSKGHVFNSPTASDLSKITLTKFKRWSNGTCQRYVSALRSILRYLFINGQISVDISTAVPGVANWQLSTLPKTLSRKEVKRLLINCDRQTSNGRLGYAVLVTMVRLGLRAKEVGALQLEDINWRRGEIVIHGKNGREDTLPLPEDVGKALSNYLRHSRPITKIRSVFISTRAPRKELGTQGVKRLVSVAFRKANIFPTGAHRLRHTAATEMLRHRVPLPEIAQVLRHKNIATTAIYAKVDRDSLRTVAQRWIGGDL